jgi:hypothetical protein
MSNNRAERHKNSGWAIAPREDVEEDTKTVAKRFAPEPVDGEDAVDAAPKRRRKAAEAEA